MKGYRYIFAPFQQLTKTRFKRLQKISSKLVILVQKDDLIPADLVRKTHKMRKRVEWVYVKHKEASSMYYHWMYLLGKADAKAEEDVEFVLLSDNVELDSIVKRMTAGGRKCVRIDLHEPLEQKNGVKKSKKPQDEIVSLRPQPKPQRGMLAKVGEEAIVRESAKATLEKLRSSGKRPENLETLKHYIHLFSTGPGTKRVSIDQVLDYLESEEEIVIRHGVVTYNF
ncbi:MAG: hypothetical protein HKN16_03025 [Saprospiraceae bacterium]|nr:hypothetical protein [Saprospiraceae bacterium]